MIIFNNKNTKLQHTRRLTKVELFKKMKGIQTKVCYKSVLNSLLSIADV